MARPRSEEARRKVIEAALTLFAERGLDATSMDSIAESSGVSKATIYKHWQNKDQLALEALGILFGADTHVPVPDTGDLHADLVTRLSHQPAQDNAHLRERVMPHVIAYSARNKEFGSAWRNRAFAPLTTALHHWIQKEQARGTLGPAIDLEIATAMLVGPLAFRNIFHKRDPAQPKPYAAGLEKAVTEAFLKAHSR